jgi:hypothetical protein
MPDIDSWIKKGPIISKFFNALRINVKKFSSSKGLAMKLQSDKIS